ncbi:Phosphoribosylformimino-5-aminoimidazole carboxamide ribotideisomerase [Zostera marina]|uniref:Phosphoribosylformimino-5-aminoimidazole carboxamide ribotideisomerase n=1 Tax=Zostera marina TaxID=29655 RepID=A0A0K9NT94_ZOSMR|nr:Phosphoribosylformimino-5-aminoimidazole carboxamide ribotideisomerase [Zostera marina]
MMSMGGVYRVLRRFCVSSSPRLTRFILHQPKFVLVEFSNGSVFNLSAEYLRVQSPAADSKIRSINGEKVIYGRQHVGIMSAEQVGNYGVRIIFDDLHKTGIYSWDYFYHLGTNKYSLMKNYIKTLKKYGLSRDPRKRR